MAFIPMPAAMEMGPFSIVSPTTISWDQPEDMYLIDADVLDADGKGPLPATRPFEVTGQNQSGTTSYATLSMKRREWRNWAQAFRDNRQVIVRLDVDGVVRDLHVTLSVG
jgi:hypothetical protein